jgi:hypothetical protein
VSVITAPGAYADIPAELYHGDPDLLPAPALSSSGAKKLLSQSPRHFWFTSPMNPDRVEQDDKPHFAIGKAAHDLVLLPDRWAQFYHVLPDGFSFSKTKAMAEEIAEAEAARDAGQTLLTAKEAETVERVAEAIKSNRTAMLALSNGVVEETLAWQDAETGVWLRARPDFRPNSIASDMPVAVVADLKFMAPTQASPSGFQKAIANNGYHQSAAFYADGLKAIYGRYPTNWLHVVVEKEAPFCVALYELPGADIERGRFLNRQAIRRFAECLSKGTEPEHWPGYADAPVQVGLPHWEQRRIDEHGNPHDTAWSAAA